MGDKQAVSVYLRWNVWLSSENVTQGRCNVDPLARRHTVTRGWCELSCLVEGRHIVAAV